MQNKLNVSSFVGGGTVAKNPFFFNQILEEATWNDSKNLNKNLICQRMVCRSICNWDSRTTASDQIYKEASNREECFKGCYPLQYEFSCDSSGVKGKWKQME